jgi:hypothetical protein
MEVAIRQLLPLIVSIITVLSTALVTALVTALIPASILLTGSQIDVRLSLPVLTAPPL